MPINLSPIDYAIVLPFIFLAGLIDAIAGGGGLISLPAYWAAGIPPHIALGTNKFSSCAGTIFSTTRYFRAGMIDIPVALTSAVLALFGSWLGARIALQVSSEFLNYFLILIIPVITLITLMNKRLGHADQAHNIRLQTRLFIAALAGLVIGCYDGFFGPGTGTFLILIYSGILHYEFTRANGNTKIVNLASNIAAVITFAAAGKIFYPLAIPAALCGITGNLLGSRLVVLKGNKVIRPVFILALILLFSRVLFNLLS